MYCGSFSIFINTFSCIYFCSSSHSSCKTLSSIGSKQIDVINDESKQNETNVQMDAKDVKDKNQKLSMHSFSSSSSSSSTQKSFSRSINNNNKAQSGGFSLSYLSNSTQYNVSCEMHRPSTLHEPDCIHAFSSKKSDRSGMISDKYIILMKIKF